MLRDAERHCRRRRLRIATGVVIATLAVNSSCSGSAPALSLPPAPPVVVVTMTEHRFEQSHEIPAGRVVFRFVNQGRDEHRPSLKPLPEDMPPIDEQLRGSQRRVSVPFVGLGNLKPGESETFAVDLIAGNRYALICFAIAPDGEGHALKGMASEFRPR